MALRRQFNPLDPFGMRMVDPNTDTPPGTTPPAPPGVNPPGQGYVPPPTHTIPGTAEQDPDYANLIKGDPGFVQSMKDLTAQGVASLDTRQKSSQRAFITFGDANATGDDDIDPTTRAAAADFTAGGLSTIARLQQAHDQAITGLKNNLAARGMIHSGELGYGFDKADLRSNQDQYDARQKLLDYLAGVQSAFATSEAQRQRDQASAYNDAANRQFQQHPIVPGTAATTTHYDPNLGVYVDGQGNWYNHNGQAWGTNPWEGVQNGRPYFNAGGLNGNPIPTP